MKRIENVFMALFVALVVMSGCSDYLTTGECTVDVDLKMSLRPMIIRDTTVIKETEIKVVKEIVEKIDTQYIYIPGEDRIDTVYTHSTDTLYVTVEVEVDRPIYIKDTVYIPGENTTDTIYIDRTDTVYVDKEVIVKEGLDTVLYGSPITIGKQLVGMNEYVIVNGKIEETNLLKANRKFDLEAGEEICVKAEPKLLSTTAKVNGNECSYEYNADTKCQDCWSVIYDSRVTFTASNGKKVNKVLNEEWTPVSLAFYNAAENRYEHLVAATVNDVIQDMDVQVITVEKEPVVEPDPEPVYDFEFDVEGFVSSATKAQIYVYFIEDGVRTGEKDLAEASFGGTLTAGKVADRISNGTVTLPNSTAVLSNGNATFSYSLDNQKFEGVFAYSLTTEAEFSYTWKGVTKKETKKVAVSPKVEATSFVNNNGVYSNTATLYANDFVVANATQSFKVEKPADNTIDGYRLVKADQTDCYDENRTMWHSTPICAWFESISNPSNTLFVAFDETTGKEIEGSREVTTGQTLPTYPLARVWNAGKAKFEAGFVYVEPNMYTYYRLDKSYHTAVSAVSTSTSSKLRDPYQGSGIYDDAQQTTTFTLSNGKKLVLK